MQGDFGCQSYPASKERSPDQTNTTPAFPHRDRHPSWWRLFSFMQVSPKLRGFFAHIVYNACMTTNILGMGKIRVGVLRGGPSNEYDISLKTGQSVLRHLPEKYISQDIFISKDGEWHLGGTPKTPEKVFRNVDLIFNALHGKYGEDGRVQSLMEQFRVPYTGSTSLPSSMAFNKALSKKRFKEVGIKTPVSIIFQPRDHVKKKILELFKFFPQPSVIKPVSGGSSVGVSFAHDFESFEKGIEHALRHGGVALVEEYIDGQEAVVSVLESASGREAYSLFPVEIRKPQEKKLFDYELKYIQPTEKICPGEFPSDVKEEMQRIALKAYRSLGLRHYANIDLIFHPKRGIYVLEANSHPGMTATSIFPRSLHTAGILMRDFLDHLVISAQK